MSSLHGEWELLEGTDAHDGSTQQLPGIWRSKSSATGAGRISDCSSSAASGSNWLRGSRGSFGTSSASIEASCNRSSAHDIAMTNVYCGLDASEAEATLTSAWVAIARSIAMQNSLATHQSLEALVLNLQPLQGHRVACCQHTVGSHRASPAAPLQFSRLCCRC